MVDSSIIVIIIAGVILLCVFGLCLKQCRTAYLRDVQQKKRQKLRAAQRAGRMQQQHRKLMDAISDVSSQPSSIHAEHTVSLQSSTVAVNVNNNDHNRNVSEKREKFGGPSKFQSEIYHRSYDYPRLQLKSLKVNLHKISEENLSDGATGAKKTLPGSVAMATDLWRSASDADVPRLCARSADVEERTGSIPDVTSSVLAGQIAARMEEIRAGKRPAKYLDQGRHPQLPKHSPLVKKVVAVHGRRDDSRRGDHREPMHI
ncbi:PREDICTED: uncharacterized protein LOC106812926 [Priapulus caudatus]|uniref:Uncharacterized protein LOC106812926 n=1 Tax=Priapulus caudatus TaxID=37621 RepID=A0ABM1EJQ1_PRICU|nr:PREDICTED: uncharacterized protein LOC106812926 [Priapulus caudatus]